MDNHSATVLIIAHRLATVIDADRILVMANGTGVEYDHPFNLLAESPDDDCITNDDGYFAKMVKATGKDSSENLFRIAKEKYI
jgi:ATP-binding cassette subfamily C (CFTR/MRP) protein 4